MRSTCWYFNDQGHLIEYTGNSLDQDMLRRSAPWPNIWHGPWSSEQAAVHVWEFRKSEYAS